MKFALYICVGLFLLAASHCGRPVVKQSDKATPSPSPSPSSSDKVECDWKGDVLGEKKSGLQKFLVGKWEGRVLPEQEIVMYLSFQEDGTAIVDYSITRDNVAKGRTSYRPYRINADNKLNICGYPDNFRIDKYGRDEFELTSGSRERPVEIEIIYICRFKRIKT